MSDTALLALGALELIGLVGLFAWVRHRAAQRAAQKERPARLVRLAVAVLALFVVVGFPLVLIITIINPTIQHERQHERLVQTGTPATATITRVEQTGSFYNQQPEVRVSLTVHPQHAPTFASHSTWVFSVNDIQTYRAGTHVKVFYDPQNHDAVAVVGIAPPGD